FRHQRHREDVRGSGDRRKSLRRHASHQPAVGMTDENVTAGASQTPAVNASKVTKTFGGVRALNAASFSAVLGEVHALVGENGAGKSTMIKILGGRIRSDSGDISIKGNKVDLHNPPDAHALGAWTVFQELTLLPWMSVAENL